MGTGESAWEQRIGTVAQALVVACLVWIGNSVVDMRTELGVLKAQVSTATARLPQVEQLTQQLKELEYTLRDLNRRLADLETGKKR